MCRHCSSICFNTVRDDQFKNIFLKYCINQLETSIEWNLLTLEFQNSKRNENPTTRSYFFVQSKVVGFHTVFTLLIHWEVGLAYRQRTSTNELQSTYTHQSRQYTHTRAAVQELNWIVRRMFQNIYVILIIKETKSFCLIWVMRNLRLYPHTCLKL